MEDNPRSTGSGPRRQTSGPHAHTDKATRTSPTAERATTTRRNAEGRTGDCPGPRKETNKGRNVIKGGGGVTMCRFCCPHRVFFWGGVTGRWWVCPQRGGFIALAAPPPPSPGPMVWRGGGATLGMRNRIFLCCRAFFGAATPAKVLQEECNRIRIHRACGMCTCRMEIRIHVAY